MSFDIFCPVEFGHDTEMPSVYYKQIYGVISSVEQLPPYTRVPNNRRLLTTLLPYRFGCYPSAKTNIGRQTYERRAIRIAVTAGGTQPGAVN